MTREIALSQGRITVVDDSDYEWLSQWSWHVNASGNGEFLYAVRNATLPDGKRRLTRMHRVIMDAPRGMTVDHINHDTLDNRRCNLRIATHAQNITNASKVKVSGTSKFRGVWSNKDNGTWYASITSNNIAKWLGTYKTEVDAAKAYDTAAREYHGEFARLNFP